MLIVELAMLRTGAVMGHDDAAVGNQGSYPIAGVHAGGLRGGTPVGAVSTAGQPATMRHDVASDACWLDVALSPSLLPGGDAARSRTVYVVVDVIRATTTLCVLFERGCRRVYVAGSIAGARLAAERLAPTHAAPLLAGEVGGLRPPGFDFGNSPAEFASADLAGRTLVFATTNGTRALHACRGGAAVLAGALRNATAVARAAVALVRSIHEASTQPRADPEPARVPQAGEEIPDGDDYAGPGIVIVCSGRDQFPASDDTICAGYLAARIEREAARRGLRVARREGPRIALATLESAQRRGIEAALAESGAAMAIADLGLAADIAWCAAVDTCGDVPVVLPVAAREDLDDLLVLETWHSV